MLGFRKKLVTPNPKTKILKFQFMIILSLNKRLLNELNTDYLIKIY